MKGILAAPPKATPPSNKGLISLGGVALGGWGVARIPMIMVDWWFEARWFLIRIGIPQSNNPFHKGILGIQTTGPQTTNEPLVELNYCTHFWGHGNIIAHFFLGGGIKLDANVWSC